TQNFDQVIFTGQSIFYKHFQGKGILYGPLVYQFLYFVQIDPGIFLPVDIGETKFGNTSLQRHLPSFETDLLGITRTGFCTFMSSGSCTALSGSLSPALDFTCSLDSTFRWF